MEVTFKDRYGTKSYTISEHSDIRVWIENEDEEGGTFLKQELFDCIDKFFKDKF